MLYMYNENTKEYVGELPRREDPLETLAAGHPVYSMPPNCTLEEPHFEEGFVTVFNEQTGMWDLLEDHRYTVVYNKRNGSFLMITELGPIPEGYSTEKPVLLEDLKQEMRDKVKEEYDRAFAEPINFGSFSASATQLAELNRMLQAFGPFDVIPYQINGEVATVDKAHVANAVKTIYIRSMLLTARRESLLNSLAPITNKKNVAAFSVDYDISHEQAELEKKTIEELNKYFAGK